VDQIDFNAFNESQGLQAQIEAYKTLYGYYPALVLADKIYWTRANRKYLTWLLRQVAQHKVDQQAINWLPHRMNPDELAPFLL